MDTASIGQTYQLVNPSRSKKKGHRRYSYDRLDRAFDIAGNIWNWAIAYANWHHREHGKAPSSQEIAKYFGELRSNAPCFRHWRYLPRWTLTEITRDYGKAQKAFHRLQKERGWNYKEKRKNGSLKGSPKPIRYPDVKSISFSVKHKFGIKIIDRGASGYGKIRLSIGDETKGERYFYFRFHTGKRPLPQDGIGTATVYREGGRYWVSFVVEADVSENMPETCRIGGFDFGLRTFLTTDSGEEIESPQHLRKELNRIKMAGRKVTGRDGRKVRGSKRHKRAADELQRAHRRIANERADWQWKLARRLCEEYDVLCFEDLNTEGMRKRNKAWARKMSDLALFEFHQKLGWVAEKTGRTIIKIEWYFPSSKLCFACGNKQDMPEGIRVYECACGYVADRDVNAARNIRRKGILKAKADGIDLPSGAARHSRVASERA